MTEATKKRIMHLVERYGIARVQEAIAGERDNRSGVARNYAACNKAWNEIGAELDKLSEAAP